MFLVANRFATIAHKSKGHPVQFHDNQGVQPHVLHTLYGVWLRVAGLRLKYLVTATLPAETTLESKDPMVHQLCTTYLIS